MRTTSHRFPPGSSRWEHNWQLPAHSPPPLSLSTGFIPVGAATGSYTIRLAHRVLSLGAKPQAESREGGAMGSCQSRLHRHKAGGGQEQTLDLRQS